MKRFLLYVVSSGIMCAVLNHCVRADTDVENQQLNFGISETFTLGIAGGSVQFGSVVPLSSPYTVPGGTTLTIDSNHKNGWTLKVKGTGNLTSGSYTIPLSQLAVRTGADPYVALSTSQQNLKTGGNGTTVLSVDYKLSVNWADTAASGYTTQVVYYLIGN